MKRLEDMTEPELLAVMQRACERVADALPPGSAFILLAATGGEEGKIAQYGGNCSKKDAAAWMRECIARWEAGDFIQRVPEGGG